MKNTLLLFTFLLNCFLAHSANFYVAPNGDNANPGTLELPVLTVQKAQELASPGDVVYIRGGRYMMQESQIAQFKNIWAYVTKLDKSNISYLAYTNERPVFDYSNVKPVNNRVVAFSITGSNIYLKGIDITGVQVTILTHTQSECIEIAGSNVIIDQVNMYKNMGIGVYIIKGSNNLILNCDAYENWDSVSEGGTGGNSDGFGCHAPVGHKNNIFRGCRAWFNSDDGFDLINNGEAVVIEDCWAFYNGYSAGFISRGDGNGFKAGGYGSTPFEKLPNPIPRNTIQSCIAVRNKQSGFYSNHHLNGSNWLYNSAYKNKRNFNMLNRKEVNAENFKTDAPGWSHLLIGNFGYRAAVSELTEIDESMCNLKENSFNSDKITDLDFISLDEKLLMAPRQADGSLPKNNFLKLKPTSAKKLAK